MLMQWNKHVISLFPNILTNSNQIRTENAAKTLKYLLIISYEQNGVKWTFQTSLRRHNHTQCFANKSIDEITSLVRNALCIMSC